jgi:hypothetical protein
VLEALPPQPELATTLVANSAGADGFAPSPTVTVAPAIAVSELVRPMGGR